MPTRIGSWRPANLLQRSVKMLFPPSPRQAVLSTAVSGFRLAVQSTLDGLAPQINGRRRLLRQGCGERSARHLVTRHRALHTLVEALDRRAPRIRVASAAPAGVLPDALRPIRGMPPRGMGEQPLEHPRADALISMVRARGAACPRTRADTARPFNRPRSRCRALSPRGSGASTVRVPTRRVVCHEDVE